jgi:hypothetical protein
LKLPYTQVKPQPFTQAYTLVQLSFVQGMSYHRTAYIRYTFLAFQRETNYRVKGVHAEGRLANGVIAFLIRRVQAD